MAEDREVLRTVWEGKLPVSFELAPEEVHTLNVPEPFYLMVPRLLYFPLVTDKIRKHFAQYVSPESATKDIWYEYNGTPVKWNYPIGLWYDLHSSPDLLLPWRITVHFENYPDTLIRCSSKDAIRTYFMSTLKEADALKHKGHIVNSMQEKDHHQLWAGFHSDRFDQFWSVNKKLMESVSGEGFKYIPVRCYLPERAPLQRLVRPIDDTTGTWTTVADMLLEYGFASGNLKVVAHGIDLPLETPLQWLSEHLSFPDNFLHLVIKVKS